MIALLAVVLSAAPVPGSDDVVMKAMADEVARAMTLTMKGDKPYYARAYVVSEDEVTVWANFGALFPPSGGKQLKLATAIRVGTPTLDNTNFQGDMGFNFMGGRGSGPAEEDVDSIRRALWLSFDSDYKKAVEQIARKKAWLQSNQVSDVVADWGPAKAEQVVLPLDPMPTFDADAWAARVKTASAACRAFTKPQSCVVGLKARRGCQRYVASDSARHRFCESKLELYISANGQAADGMPVGAEWKQIARNESELPDEATLIAKVKETATQLEKKLAAVSPREDYAGPVLFTSEAAPQFFLSALAAPLSQPREALGGRDQGRLTERMGKHIAVSQLTATDDPSKQTWTSPTGQELPLQGYFAVDDDGVRPQPITLVKEGVLQTYYMSRIPTKAVPLTNGHARGDQGSTGNLFITTSQPTPMAAMRKRLVELAKEEDLDYGLLIAKLPQGYDRLASGSQLQLPNLPLLVFKVYADGRPDELVRGFSFKPATYRVLKDIVAMGDDRTLLNTEQFGQNVSAVAPSVLIRLLELTRARDDFSKPPVLARPDLAGKPKAAAK